MNTSSKILIYRAVGRHTGSVLGLFAVVTILCNNGNGNEIPTTNQVSKGEAPQSVFADDPGMGRDPFFPRSSRRVASKPLPTVTYAPQNSAPATQFKLMGISGTANRKIALINNRTFEAGEDGEIKTAEGKLRIRCLEVKANSVVLLLGGNQRKEIFLGEPTTPLGPSASAKL